MEKILNFTIKAANIMAQAMDTLPICHPMPIWVCIQKVANILKQMIIQIPFRKLIEIMTLTTDRKSTRLNSSHVKSSYAVFCLTKKKEREARDPACDLGQY